MKRYTLTFDNGPDPDVTPRVLDILARHGVKAHFYVLGKLIATPEGRGCVERTLAEGHLVANHSYTHETPLGNDPRPDAVDQEIAATQALLDKLSGSRTRLTPRSADGDGIQLVKVDHLTPENRVTPIFRPFGGGGVIGPHLLSSAARDHLIAKRYTCVLWTSVPRDWEDAHGWPARALADIETQDHAVVVLHDIPNASLAQLDSFLAEAARRGYQTTLDLPASVLPIVDGVAHASLAPIVGAV
ncbi:MAG: polysaccharide deacetylase family protein [Kofleriaceae bacterium]